MISITENYGFETDRYNFILFYTGKRQKGVFGKPNSSSKTGEMVDFSEKIGYYNTVFGMLQAAAQHAANRKADENQISTIAEYLDAFNKTSAELEAAVSKATFKSKLERKGPSNLNRKAEASDNTDDEEA